MYKDTKMNAWTAQSHLNYSTQVFFVQIITVKQSFGNLFQTMASMCPIVVAGDDSAAEFFCRKVKTRPGLFQYINNI